MMYYLRLIIFFAAITGIDSQLYDAAAVDGAGRWKKMLHITIPGMLPTLITLLIISIGAILNNGFEQYYVFVNPMIQEKNGSIRLLCLPDRDVEQ